MTKTIGIIAGEPNSISSEIIFKSWKLRKQYTHKPIVIIGSIDLLNKQKKKLKFSIKIKEVKYSISEFSNIYNYKYEYALGPSDVISINLTDTDDIDGSYTISPNGEVDLPFVGIIDVENLTLNESKKKLISVLKKYYKNYDLQVSIEEFNSSKVYILGAVKTQLTIDLNQKPIKLIDAAIQANYNPNSADKNYGNKALLRRDNLL